MSLLSPGALAKARRNNPGYAMTVGVRTQMDVGGAAFATAVAEFQAATPGLAVDGMLGPNTCAALMRADREQSGRSSGLWDVVKCGGRATAPRSPNRAAAPPESRALVPTTPGEERGYGRWALAVALWLGALGLWQRKRLQDWFARARARTNPAHIGISGRSRDLATSLAASLASGYFPGEPAPDTEWCVEHNLERLFGYWRVIESWSAPKRIAAGGLPELSYAEVIEAVGLFPDGTTDVGPRALRFRAQVMREIAGAGDDYRPESVPLLARLRAALNARLIRLIVQGYVRIRTNPVGPVQSVVSPATRTRSRLVGFAIDAYREDCRPSRDRMISRTMVRAREEVLPVTEDEVRDVVDKVLMYPPVVFV